MKKLSEMKKIKIKVNAQEIYLGILILAIFLACLTEQKIVQALFGF